MYVRVLTQIMAVDNLIVISVYVLAICSGIMIDKLFVHVFLQFIKFG